MVKADPCTAPLPPRQTWTPKLVQERLLEALRWARYNLRAVGPAPARSPMPPYRPTLEDYLAEGWDLPDASEEAALRVRLSPEQVDEMLWVLDWCRLYLAPERPGDARMLNLWLRCRVHRLGFDKALQARAVKLSRRHADRMKDRALSHLSCRLDSAGFYP